MNVCWMRDVDVRPLPCAWRRGLRKLQVTGIECQSDIVLHWRDAM